jgi:hypothetical protein
MDQTGKSFSSFFETFWAPGDDDESDKQDVLDFYVDFLDENDKMKAEIISHEVLEGNGKKYTVYIIKVVTTFLEYKINKRFSLFSSLQQQLVKKYKQLNLQEINFPSKKFFGSLDIETIEKRKAHLNQFLDVLCKKYKEYNLVEFMEFLDVRKMFLKASTNPNSLPFMDKPLRTTQETEQILKFVVSLNKNSENLISTFNEFDKFYFNSKPKLNLDVVKHIMTGDTKTKGILHFCGKFDETQESHLVCSVGLAFLTKLLSFETNTEAELFNTIYSKVHPKLLKKLKLQSHIVGKQQKNCKANALRLLHTYISRHPNENLKDLLEDNEAVLEYEKWKTSHSTTSIRAEHYEVRNNSPTKEESKHFDDRGKSEDCLSLELSPTHMSEVFKDNQIKWTLLDMKEDWIRLEYSSNLYLKIRILLDADVQTCVDYFSSQSASIGGPVEVRDLKTKDDTLAKVIKYDYDSAPHKYMLIICQRKVEEEDDNDTVRILEKPYNTQGLMINKDEAIGKRLMSITIKSVTVPPNDEKKAKVKMLIKSMNEVAKNYVTKEIHGANPGLIQTLKKLKDHMAQHKENNDEPKLNLGSNKQTAETDPAQSIFTQTKQKDLKIF